MDDKRKTPIGSKSAKNSKAKPGSLAPSGLPWKRDAFCCEYLKDRNAAQAAIRAGYSEKAAKEQGYRLLTNAHVKARINELMRKRARQLEIEAMDVLQRLWQKATADVNELVRVERRCCRYCHGLHHEYQWRTAREFKDEQNSAILEMSQGNADALLVLGQALDEGRTLPGIPHDVGGYGFDQTADPNPECPECNGEGTACVVVADTREALSHPLYEGVKQTKEGIEIKIADRMKALEQVARHLSFFNDKGEMGVSDELLQAARQINTASPALDARYMVKNAYRLDSD